MANLTKGYWPDNYFLTDYWPIDYWLEYGAAAATATSTAEATIQAAINAYLVADTLTHDQVADRVYWVKAPQKPTLPYMSYSVVSDPHDPHSFDKTSAGQARVQFNVYDDNKYRSDTIAKTIRNRLKRKTGNFAGKTLAAMNCQGVKVIKVPDHDIYQGTFDAMVDYYD
jgi:hypothetical protein